MGASEIVVVPGRVGIERGSVVVLGVLEILLGEDENERAGDEGKREKKEKEEED